MAVATAAPAVAASVQGIQGQLVSNGFRGNPTDPIPGVGRPTTVLISTQLASSYVTNGPSASSVSLTVVAPAPTFTAAAPTSVSGQNWTFDGMTSGGSTRVYQFTYSGAIAGSQYTTVPQLDFKLAFANDPAGTFTVTCQASAVQFTSVNDSFTRTYN